MPNKNSVFARPLNREERAIYSAIGPIYEQFVKAGEIYVSTRRKKKIAGVVV